MMEYKVWHTPAAISWLQVILAERFGHAFDLQLLPGDTRIALHLPGDTRRITLALDGATFSRADSDLPYTQWNASAEVWHTALPGNLPAPGAAHLPAPLISATESGWHIGYDILGLTYWALTRQEEVGRNDLDEHGRFTARVSHAYKHGYLERPMVDEWLDVIRQLAQQLWPSLSLNRIPLPAITPSHDVDFPSRYAHCHPRYFVRNLLKDCLVRHRPLEALKGLSIRASAWGGGELSHQDPYNTFGWIMDQSEDFGLTSYFYIVCGGRHRFDPGYAPGHPAIRRLIREIHARGHFVGLHPSYSCMEQPELLENEYAVLRRIAAEEGVIQAEWGVRMHYLRCRYPDLWRQLDALGISHDATMGYADKVGFRAGTAHPYRAFDPVTQQTCAVEVRPLVAMEGTLYSTSYMGLDSVARIRKLISLHEACMAIGGEFSLLWHNSEFTEQGMRADYLQALSVVKKTIGAVA